MTLGIDIDESPHRRDELAKDSSPYAHSIANMGHPSSDITHGKSKLGCATSARTRRALCKTDGGMMRIPNTTSDHRLWICVAPIQILHSVLDERKMLALQEHAPSMSPLYAPLASFLGAPSSGTGGDVGVVGEGGGGGGNGGDGGSLSRTTSSQHFCNANGGEVKKKGRRVQGMPSAPTPCHRHQLRELARPHPHLLDALPSLLPAVVFFLRDTVPDLEVLTRIPARDTKSCQVASTRSHVHLSSRLGILSYVARVAGEVCVLNAIPELSTRPTTILRRQYTTSPKAVIYDGPKILK
ncbi:hypothetical protein EI94DRAFT_1705740 [Lactarius quietus]|nr:hypothetical protein EI94DRAFT_1705740 [Lactarius quietus]